MNTKLPILFFIVAVTFSCSENSFDEVAPKSETNLTEGGDSTRSNDNKRPSEEPTEVPGYNLICSDSASCLLTEKGTTTKATIEKLEYSWDIVGGCQAKIQECSENNQSCSIKLLGYQTCSKGTVITLDIVNASSTVVYRWNMTKLLDIETAKPSKPLKKDDEKNGIEQEIEIQDLPGLDFTGEIQGAKLALVGDEDMCLHMENPGATGFNPLNSERLSPVDCASSNIFTIKADDTTEGRVNIESESGTCWDVVFAEAQPGRELIQWDCHYNNGQELAMIEVRKEGDPKPYYQISSAGLCIALDENQAVIYGECNENDPFQVFSITSGN